MNLEKALTIPGWMTEDELRWLAEQASAHRAIVEIGSWRGRSTRALADNTPGTVWAVDTWKGSQEEQHLEEFRAHADNPNWLFEDFASNMWPLANVNAVQRDSQDAARYLSLRCFDMIFIDGSHEYEDVRADIDHWLPRVKHGGTICGHDYLPDHYPGVVQAVNETFKVFTMGPGAWTSVWCVRLT